MAGRGLRDAALRYRHTETHIFPAANLALKVSRDPQTSLGQTEIASDPGAPARSLSANFDGWIFLSDKDVADDASDAYVTEDVIFFNLLDMILEVSWR